MNKVMAAVANPFVDARQNFVGFTTLTSDFIMTDFITAALFGLGLPSARLRQSLFVLAEEARVVYELAVGQSQKAVQARVKANHVIGLWQEVVFLLHGKADKPFGTDAANRAGFDYAEDSPMEFGLNLNRLAAHGNGNRTVTNLKAALRVGDAVVLTFAFEPREAWGFLNLSFSRLPILLLHPTEEGAEGKVNAHGHILQNLTIDGFDFWKVFAPLREHLLLLVAAYRGLCGFVLEHAVVDKAVVDEAARFQRVFKFACLFLCGEQPIF